MHSVRLFLLILPLRLLLVTALSNNYYTVLVISTDSNIIKKFAPLLEMAMLKRPFDYMASCLKPYVFDIT